MSPSDALIHFCELEKQRNFEPMSDILSTPVKTQQKRCPAELKSTEDVETQTDADVLIAVAQAE